jgi:hypothetical protein
MKTFFQKHWAVIVFVITALIDTNQGFLESIFDEQWQIVLVRLVGSLLLAYKWNPALIVKKDVNAFDEENNITDPIRPGGPKNRF